MDRKAISVISICIALLFVWPLLIQKLYPPPPVPPGGATNGIVRTLVTTNSPQGQAVPSTVQTLSNRVDAVVRPVVNATAPEQSLVISNSVARYTFTTHGGGLKSVELLAFPESVACNAKKAPDAGKVASLNSKATVPALALLGDSTLQGNGVYSLSRTATGVRAEQPLANGVVVVKDFFLGSNYVLGCTVRFENRTSQPITIPQQEIVIGTATPMDLLDDGTKVGFYWGRADKVEHITSTWFKNGYLGGCVASSPRSLYQEGESNVTWAAVHNQFFSMAAIPTNGHAYQVVSREYPLPAPTNQDLAETPRATLKPVAYQTGLVYPGVTIPANQALERQIDLYAGPKEYKTLSRLGAFYKHDLEQVMGFDQVLFGSFSGLFAKLLLLAMNGLHNLGIAYGLTIVVITVLIKALFWPLTKASTRSMKRMQALQPEMKLLQEKYKDDPAKLNRKMMEFWKEHKVNPFGGCIPLLLQMPVFIGFFAMIQTAIELRGASFLWACDLTKPDTLFIIPGLNFPFNPMPLLMGVTMLWQARLQPTAPGMDPAQAKLMKYMPLLFLVMLYNFSSGLTLYWTVQNLLSILQTKITRAQDEKDSAQQTGKTTVVATGGGKKKS